MFVKRDYKTLLPKLMEALFHSVADRQEAQAMLDEYHHNEKDRVCVGILKASNGDLVKIRVLVELAKCDWRDLLVEAEFRKSFGKDKLQKSDPKKYRKLEQKEASEYDEWISSTLAT